MTRKPLDRYNSADIAQLVRNDTHHIECDRYPKQDFENGTLSRINGEDSRAHIMGGLVVIWVLFCALVGMVGMGWHLAAWWLG